MAVGLKNSVQISAYIAPELKKQMEEIAASNRRKNLSFQVEEALERYVKQERPPSFPKPTRKARSGKKKLTAV